MEPGTRLRHSLSGRDRSQSLCVLRRSGSRGQTRWTGAWRPPFRATASSLARAGNVELDRYLQLMLPGVQYAITPDLKSNLLAHLRCSRAEV